MKIRAATEADVPVILRLIRGLAEYERLADQAVVTEDDLRSTLFGLHRFAEVVLAEEGPIAVAGFNHPEVVGFALFFHNYSTFRGKPGLYLEDLFVVPEARGQAIGGQLLLHLKKIAIARGCGRMEWSVLSWNHPAVGFYRKFGAEVMEDWRICRISLP